MTNPGNHTTLIYLPQTFNRSETIDMLRAILAIWVLFTHTIPWARIMQGDVSVPASVSWVMQMLTRVFQPVSETHPAVLGFIVLSGYCIHRNGLRRGESNILQYAIRRAFRIYPVYLLAIIAGIICYHIAFSFDPQHTRMLSGTKDLNPFYLVAKVIGISAFYPSLHASTFQGNAPLHTVMVEIWLYAIYPLGFLFVRRYSERVFWIVLSSIWILSMILLSVYPGLHPWWHNGSVMGYLLYWWIGAKFVDTSFWLRINRFWPYLCLSWLGLSVFLLLGDVATPFFCEFRKVIFAFLIGLLIVRLDRLSLSFRLGMNQLGKAGYSIYALHAPVVYTLVIGQVKWWGVALVTILLGVFVFWIYERPLMLIGKRLAHHNIV